MIALPAFRLMRPATLAEATRLAAEPDARLIAGGTGLLPNLRLGIGAPRTLVSLDALDDLRRIEVSGKEIRIGACVTLDNISRQEQLPAALREAARSVAAPAHRSAATLGGNLCLDTRCTYYDQTGEWRKAIDFCLKKDGTTCWVAPSSPRCLAVSSTDLAPMLQALGARVRLVSHAGVRELAVADLYHNDGMQYMARTPEEILSEVLIPNQGGWRSAYWKLRRRGAIDFPVAAVAAAARVDATGRVEAVRLVAGAVGSRPMEAAGAARHLVGESLTDERIAAAAHAVYEVAKPMDNADFELVWRKRMVTALATYALREIRGDDMRAVRQRLARQAI
jgi:4-hydroxybenzoyl-CoA reductase subunit beta